MITNILDFIAVFISFIFLFIIIPFHLLDFKLEEGRCLERIIKSMAVGMFTVITVVFILVFLKILSALTLSLSLFMIFCGVKWRFYRERVKKTFSTLVEIITMMLRGYYRPALVIGRYLRRKGRRLKEIIRLFTAHLVDHLILLIALGYGLVIRSEVGIQHYYYSMPDGYVHTHWVNFLSNNKPFVAGIYPFGLHNAALSIALLFHIDVVSVMRFFGICVSIFIILTIYMFFKKIFKSRFAANFVLIVYCMTNLIGQLPAARQSASLPQELAMLFLFPAVGCMLDIIKEQKKEDFILFGLYLALITYCHFYITIVAAIMCVCFIVFYLGQVFKKRLFFKLVITVFISTFFSVWPLAAGLLMGYQWEQSMGWAMGVMTRNEGLKDELKSEEIQEESNESYYVNEAGQIIAISHLTDEEYNALSYEDRVQVMVRKPLAEKLFLQNLIKAKDLYFFNLFVYYNWANFYLLSLPVFLFYAIFVFLRNRGKADDDYGRRLLGLWIGAIALNFMLLLQYFDLPEILDMHRLSLFTYITSPAILAVYLEMIFANSLWKGHYRLQAAVTAGCFLGMMSYLYTQEHFKDYNIIDKVQHDGAVIAYYKIIREYPRNSWTIVSPIQEYPMILNKGYHSELWEFITAQSEIAREPVYQIPSKYIFFYVEKIPVGAEQLEDYEDYETAPLFNIDHYASQPLAAITEGISPATYYYDISIRTVLVSKMRKWMEAYEQYFPDEIKLFYQDDQIEVYLLEQNTDQINNLILDFGYN